MQKLILISLFILSACSSAAPKKDESAIVPNPTPAPVAEEKKAVSIEAKLAGAQDNTPYVTEIKFETGSATLTPGDQKKISDLIATAKTRSERNHQPIKGAKFLVWSDQEAPPPKGKDLPDAAIKLAEARGQALTVFVHEKEPAYHLHTINMAKEPSAFHQFIKSDSVRIRESIDIAGKDDPKASHAIMMLVVKKK